MTPDRRGPVHDRRAGTVEALEAIVDEHVERLENRLATWLKRGIIAFAVIGIACAVALVGFGVVLNQIQDTREDFVRTTCDAQNVRHDKAVNKFNKAADESIERNPEFAKEIEEGRSANIAIIEALAPLQDCTKLSLVAVGKEEPPPPDIKTQTTTNKKEKP